MRCRITQEEFHQRNLAIGAISSSVFCGLKTKIAYRCIDCDKIFIVSPGKVWCNKQIRCYECSGARGRLLTQEEFEYKNKAIGAISYDIYKTIKYPTKYICCDCKQEFLVTPDRVWKQKQLRCYTCGRKNSGKNKTYKQDKFIQKNKDVGAISYARYFGTHIKILYVCTNCGKSFLVTPGSVWYQKQVKCGNCELRINGTKTSGKSISLKKYIPQFFICEYKIYYAINKKYKITIDWAGIYNGYKIAIEYDEWWWHGHKQKEDYKRVKKLVKMGWKVLRIKAHDNLPTKDQIDKALYILTTTNKNYTYIRLKGWGKGKTFADRKKTIK
jgi:DNA-directed RNA polymerase subunit RPC12/RpoP